MKKIDLRKELAHLWKASAKQASLVEVPAMPFLMVDGRGDPGASPAFQEAVGALYGLAYTLKFALKAEGRADWKVMGLEALWWADDMGAFAAGRRDEWRWTLLIMQPQVVTPAAVEAARERLRERKDPPGLDRVRFERLDEGLSAQILHVGPYDQEGPTVERLHAFAREAGCELAGKHHEIYLNDPRRTAPAKLKTILRQPVRRTGRK